MAVDTWMIAGMQNVSSCTNLQQQCCDVYDSRKANVLLRLHALHVCDSAAGSVHSERLGVMVMCGFIACLCR